MHIITGGTGHVGSAVAEALLQNGEAVTIVSRSSKEAKDWISKGAQVAVADIYDTAALHRIFKTGKSVFVLNPPADPITNTSVQERKTIASLIEALKHTDIEKIVALSVKGAQPGDNNGDLGALYELEQKVAELPYPYSIIRPAYYMSNWTEALPMIQEKKEMISFYPADLKFPMVAPKDIGELAARLLMEKDNKKINTIKGPELYSAADVAAALSKALHIEIKLTVVPEEQWRATYLSMGFSEEAADSYVQMATISLAAFQKPADSGDFISGKITLQEFIDEAVKG